MRVPGETDILKNADASAEYGRIDSHPDVPSRLTAARAEIAQLRQTLSGIQQSRSWRVTAPLRILKRTLQFNTKGMENAAAPLNVQSSTPTDDAGVTTAPTRLPSEAVSINKDFCGLKEFLTFANANPIFFDDFIEQNIIRHCHIHGIRSIAMGFCDRTEVVVTGPESREHLMVRGLNSRQRAVLEELYTFLDNHKIPTDQARIYGHEAITPMALFLRGRFPKYLGTEFAQNEAQRRDLFPILHGDICHSDFQSSSFDVIVSCDVLEHIPDIDEGLSESARILKKGGRFIATMPFLYCRQDSQRFAAMEDGRIKHLIEPPIYHGNPMDPSRGALVFEIPGWDILERARRAGFSHTTMRFVCEQNKGIVASSLGGVPAAKGVFLAVFDR